jgi:hypothetical protein
VTVVSRAPQIESFAGLANLNKVVEEMHKKLYYVPGCIVSSNVRLDAFCLESAITTYT